MSLTETGVAVANARRGHYVARLSFLYGKEGGVSVVTLEDCCQAFIAENLSGMTACMRTSRKRLCRKSIAF